MRNLVILCEGALNAWTGATARFMQIASGLAQHGWQTTLVTTAGNG